ncbi:MAG: glycosyl hydrolase family 28-related protein [Planctomycetota bacterium]|nr:glycosyl hydrolase family 28-related protein [Planctomycetota bacterium]
MQTSLKASPGSSKWSRQGSLLLLIPCAVMALMAARRPPADPAAIAGWVVVRKSPNDDDTATIQAAIDAVAKTGGVVFFPAGTYRHTGLTGRANVHLQGVHVTSVQLDYTPKTGDGITLVTDPDNFMVSNLSLISSGRSDGWGIRGERGAQRSLTIEQARIIGFENGMLLTNALGVSIRQCRIGHTYPQSPRGIGLKFGDGRKLGGNGVTVEDCYFSSLDKGIVSYVQACLISRPIIELCHTGIETHGTTSILAPWYDSSTDVAHVSVQPNTVGGGSSGTGALLLGYGSSGWKVQFGSEAERNRSLILPERLDFMPGDDTARPRGVSFGQVVIDRDGVIHAKEFRTLPD